MPALRGKTSRADIDRAGPRKAGLRSFS